MSFTAVDIERLPHDTDGCLLFGNVSNIYNGSLARPDFNDPIIFEEPALLMPGKLRDPLFKTGQEVGADEYSRVRFVSTNLFRIFSKIENGYGFVFDEEEIAMGGSVNFWIPVGDSFSTVPVLYVGELNLLHGAHHFSRNLKAPPAFGQPIHSSALSHLDASRRTKV